ncbi:MAG: cadherin-like beta sandwich domain-containing protein [Spirochaetales bacterium]|nr:cadherin-like beta sandwich domain-containing protein [Spirochaetales bacterium]
MKRSIFITLLSVVMICFFGGCEQEPPNVYLSGLEITGLEVDPEFSDIEITPAFSQDVTDYTASVCNLIAGVSVSAEAVDTTAVVSGAGDYTLDVGDNTVTISVVSEDGTNSLDYTITIERRPAVLGHYYEDVVFGIEDSPYYVTGDIVIETGVTCTIDPGVEFIIAEGDAMGSGDTEELEALTEIIVDGTLDINGTESQPVVFRSVNSAEGEGQTERWFGIEADGSGKTINMEYARVYNCQLVCGTRNGAEAFVQNTQIDSCELGVFTNEGSITVSDCEIKNCPNAALRTVNPVLADFSGCVIAGNHNGVYCHDNSAAAAQVEITNCTFDANSSAVYSNLSDSEINVLNCIITNTTGWAVYCVTADTIIIDFSDVWNSTLGDYYLTTAGAACISENPLYADYPDDLTITEHSPCRGNGNDGNDMGALPYIAP